jgi:hypothetical protein
MLLPHTRPCHPAFTVYPHIAQPTTARESNRPGQHRPSAFSRHAHSLLHQQGWNAASESRRVSRMIMQSSSPSSSSSSPFSSPPLLLILFFPGVISHPLCKQPALSHDHFLVPLPGSGSGSGFFGWRRVRESDGENRVCFAGERGRAFSGRAYGRRSKPW